MAPALYGLGQSVLKKKLLALANQGFQRVFMLKPLLYQRKQLFKKKISGIFLIF